QTLARGALFQSADERRRQRNAHLLVDRRACRDRRTSSLFFGRLRRGRRFTGLTQVGRAHEVFILRELRGRPFVLELALLQHVRALRDGQSLTDELLHEQNRQPALGELRDDREEVGDERRRQALGHLVEHEQLGLRDQPARERQHLLLAAGQRPRGLRPALFESREHPVHLVQAGLYLAAR